MLSSWQGSLADLVPVCAVRVSGSRLLGAWGVVRLASAANLATSSGSG